MNRRQLLGGLAATALVPPTHARGRAQRTHGPWVDGLTFLTDDPGELAASGLSGLILDVSSVERVDSDDGSIRYFRSFDACLRSVTAMRRQLREWPNAFLAAAGSDIERARASNRAAVFFQLQGLEPMGEKLERIDLFYELGVRVLQFTHHNDNPFGGGAIEPEWTGLTDLGREAVTRMNRLGIVPDISHASEVTALDVCTASERPVILSHGAARALVDNARCAPDSVIRAIADNGGVMGIFMMSMWLTTDPAPGVEHLIAQLRHVISVGGIDTVGIANDYSVVGQQALAAIDNDNAKGVEGYLPWWESMNQRGVRGFDRPPEHVVIPALNDVRRMFTIHAALEDAGFSAAEIDKIMGGNWVRALTESLGP